jgi:hypothetical protein
MEGLVAEFLASALHLLLFPFGKKSSFGDLVGL